MPIDKAINQAPDAGILVIAEGAPEEAPEIEIVLEPDGGAVVEIGPEAAKEVDFYANLAEVVDPDDLGRIAIDVSAMFEADKGSRSDWEQMYAKGLELLGLRMEERTKPFRGASGATHPMLQEAIIQFQSQAFKELMPAGGPVRTQVLGKETVDKFQQAARVQDFMNYQLTTVMEEYTPEFDQLLYYTGYGGSTFKKVYYDFQLGRMVSRLCLADDVYIPYNGSSVVSQCSRLTHRIAMDSNEFRKRVLSGEYLDIAVDLEPTPADPSQIQAAIDKVTGIQPTDQAGEVFLLEMLVDLDLPGFEEVDESGEPTGIKLPYVVTLAEDSLKVIGIRRNWREDDELKRRRNYFVHYVLVEGPGAYGLGFVHLIGGLSKSATSALRQLIDAGTLANLPAGFKAKGARIADDSDPIQPGEWRDIDAGGAELQSSLLPLPYKEPSQVLAALLEKITQEGRRLGAISDMNVSDMSAQAPVGTTLAILERTLKPMAAVQARVHFAMKQEFKLLKAIIAEYADEPYDYIPEGVDRRARSEDYAQVDVIPVSDPNASTMAQRVVQYQAAFQLSQSAPQLYDLAYLHRQMNETLGIKNIDKLIPSSEDAKPRRCQRTWAL